MKNNKIITVSLATATGNRSNHSKRRSGKR